MFDGQIVCLGAGITNSGESSPVESIIENRRLRAEADNVLTVNGEAEALPVQEAGLEDIVSGSADVSGTSIPNVSWAHLEGNVEGSDIGYYFPGGDQTISVRKGKNAGDWSLIGTSEGAASETYLEMWFDHGANPKNDTYEYVLLPGLSAGETESYSKEPGITVLANTPFVQAVSTADGLLTGANFWTDQPAQLGALSVNRAASVMTEESDNGRYRTAGGRGCESRRERGCAADGQWSETGGSYKGNQWRQLLCVCESDSSGNASHGRTGGEADYSGRRSCRSRR